jgi:hypothetical protein
MKTFFRLTVMKCVLSVFLILLTVYIPRTTEVGSMGPYGVVSGVIPTDGIGYPSFFGTIYSGDAGYTSFNLFNFILNVVVFYSISCVLVFLFKKLFKARPN